jgi:hypothetical protein
MNQVVVDAGCLAGGWQLLEQRVDSQVKLLLCFGNKEDANK